MRCITKDDVALSVTLSSSEAVQTTCTQVCMISCNPGQQDSDCLFLRRGIWVKLRTAVMEIIKLVLVVELLLTNVFCHEVDADSWREGIQEIKRPNYEVIQDILVRITGRPGARQYPGLLRKKGSAKSQTARKRHKFHTFVGLMGKRSFGNRGAP